MKRKQLTDEQLMSRNAIISAISENRNWLIIFGIILSIAGIAAILFPLVSGVYVVLVIGAILTISGIVQVFQAFRYRKWGGMLLAFFAGIFWIVAGLILLARPMEGIAVFTLFLAIAFLAEGILKLVLAFKMRPIKNWRWMLFDGAVAAILGILLWAQFPYSAMWAIGVLTGLNILSSGITTLFIALFLDHPDHTA